MLFHYAKQYQGPQTRQDLNKRCGELYLFFGTEKHHKSLVLLDLVERFRMQAVGDLMKPIKVVTSVVLSIYNRCVL